MSVGVPAFEALPPDLQHCPFEGAEKLLEVWFAPTAHTPLGLRDIPGDVWQEKVLDPVNCKILSWIQSDACTVYLLSESSLFVFPDKIILKTCGTTTLLLGLAPLLELASGVGMDKVHRVFYSRKRFMFPERQKWPHTAWEDEVQYLDGVLEGGAAYVVGKSNGDHWNLYVTRAADEDDIDYDVLKHEDESAATVAPVPVLSGRNFLPHVTSLDEDGMSSDPESACDTLQNTPRASPPLPPFNGLHSVDQDCTIEILMTRLDPIRARLFYLDSHPDLQEGTEAGLIVTERSGLLYALPDSVDYKGAFTLDAYQFAPCGYSLNALRGSDYLTVHVTPEPEASFASFETNVRLTSRRQLEDLVSKVVAVFGAGSVSVTVFRSMEDIALEHHETLKDAHVEQRDVIVNNMAVISPQNSSEEETYGEQAFKYRRTDRIVYELDGYALGYVHFEKRRARPALSMLRTASPFKQFASSRLSTPPVSLDTSAVVIA